MVNFTIEMRSNSPTPSPKDIYKTLSETVRNIVGKFSCLVSPMHMNTFIKTQWVLSSVLMFCAFSVKAGPLRGSDFYFLLSIGAKTHWISRIVRVVRKRILTVSSYNVLPSIGTV